jgi:hypothetical protein
MKFNIKHISKFSLALLLAGGTMSSCTKNFEDYNKNNIGLTDEDLKGDGQDLVLFLRNAQMSIYNFSGAGDPNSYQVQQNLNADVFSGFFMSPTPFNSGQNNLNYAMVNGWNGEPFQVLYLNVIKSIEKLKVMDLQKPIQHYGVRHWLSKWKRPAVLRTSMVLFLIVK